MTRAKALRGDLVAKPRWMNATGLNQGHPAISPPAVRRQSETLAEIDEPVVP